MGPLLASPRRRRRLARVALVVLALAAAVAVAWLARDGGREFAGDAVRAPVSARQAPAEAPDAEVPFTAARRGEVVPVASEFVATAVERKRLDDGWRLVHPELRRGYTLAEWRTGDIPVVPYPVGSARWELQYSLENEVGLYVLLTPRRGSEVAPTTFLIALKRARRDGPWLVSAWAPSAGAVYSELADDGGVGPVAAAEPGGAFDQGNLDPLFLLLPVAGTAGIVLAGAAFLAVRGWRRGRRAAAGATRELPPLPPRYRSSS